MPNEAVVGRGRATMMSDDVWEIEMDWCPLIYSNQGIGAADRTATYLALNFPRARLPNFNVSRSAA